MLSGPTLAQTGAGLLGLFLSGCASVLAPRARACHAGRRGARYAALSSLPRARGVRMRARSVHTGPPRGATSMYRLPRAEREGAHIMCRAQELLSSALLVLRAPHRQYFTLYCHARAMSFLPEVREFIKEPRPKTNATRGGRKAHRPTPKTRTIPPPSSRTVSSGRVVGGRPQTPARLGVANPPGPISVSDPTRFLRVAVSKY